MAEIKITNFSVPGCLAKIDNILNSNPQGKMEKRKFIPSEAEMTFDNGYYVDCVALSVDIRGSSQMPDFHTKPVLAKIYRAYLSSITSLMKSCGLNRHIRIVGDAVLGIFNSPNPAIHVQEVYAVGLRIYNVISMLNDKLQKKGYQTINVGIGISYGEALAVKAGLFGSGINDIIWMGDVVNTASKIGNKGNKDGNGQYMICPSVYGFLPPGDAQLFTANAAEGCYHGNVYHKETQVIYEKIVKSRATTPSRATPTPYIPSPDLINPLANLSRRQTMSTLLGGLGGDSIPTPNLSNLGKALYEYMK